MEQKVKVRLDRGETRSGVRQGYRLSPILFNFYSECLTKEALVGLGDFNIGGQIIQTVKYAEDGDVLKLLGDGGLKILKKTKQHRI